MSRLHSPLVLVTGHVRYSIDLRLDLHEGCGNFIITHGLKKINIQACSHSRTFYEGLDSTSSCCHYHS